jgi:glutamate racemase
MSRMRRRIGMFDSGLGGLTVLAQLRREVPDAEIVYAADTARVPYGDRPLAQVAGFARGIIEHLKDFDPSLIVIACGTSCSAFDALGAPASEIPLLPVVDCGARAAVQASANGQIGVIATAATARSGVFERKIRQASPSAHVTTIGAPKLVPLVESGAWQSAAADAAVADYCRDLAACDTVVLGCTHFPLLRSSFERALGPHVSLVDPAIECAKSAAVMLEGAHRGDGSLTFLVSGDVDAFVRHAAALGVIAPTHVRAVDFSDDVKHAEHH